MMLVFQPLRNIVTIISICIVFMFWLPIAQSEDTPLLIIKEHTPGSKIIFNWKTSNGEVKEGVWVRAEGDRWYRKMNVGCGLPNLCNHDAVMINQFVDHDCIYVLNGQNYNRSIEAATRYRIKEGANCNILDNKYRVLDITHHFEFTNNGIEPKTKEFKRIKRPESFDLDVNANGQQIITTLYQYTSSIFKNTLIHIDLKKKVVKEILFPDEESIIAGFVNQDEFVVQVSTAWGVPGKVEFIDANFGLLYRFDQNLKGRLINILNASSRGVCQGFLKRFDVNSRGITIEGSSPGVCGHIGYRVVGHWQKDGSLLPVYLQGLGDIGDHVNTLKKEVSLINYAARSCEGRYGTVCNINDYFFYAEADDKGISVKPLLSMGREGQKDKIIRDEIPDRSYLYPVWKKNYDGLADLSAKLYAFTENDYLNIELDVTDDIVISKNPERLNNDHVELWLYTQPVILASDKIMKSVNYIKSWISKNHYYIGKNSVTLLDNERYKKAGFKKDKFTNFTTKINVKHYTTKNGYRKEISIPLNDLPIYQMTDKRQCFRIMIDVVDVDKNNTQEALVSTNIFRKWGSLGGATRFCFDHNKNLSDAYFMNKRSLGITKPENNMALVLFNGKNYRPVQLNDTSTKISPFAKLTSINYRKATMVELPQSERDKIVHTGMEYSCSIEKAYYINEYNKLLLLTNCPSSNTSSHLTVVEAGKKPIFRIEHQEYFLGCYRHCDDSVGKDISDLEYGVLNDNIHVIQLNKNAFYFTNDNKQGNVSASGGLPKTADLIISDISRIKQSRSDWGQRTVFQLKQPLILNGKRLAFSSRVYSTPLAKYVSYRPSDISCIEGSIFQNYITTGKLAQFEFFPKECMSEFLDKQQIKRPVKALNRAKQKLKTDRESLDVDTNLSQETLDAVLSNQSIKKLSLMFSYQRTDHNFNLLAKKESQVEDLILKLRNVGQMHLLSSIKYLKHLRHLELEVPITENLNEYLLSLKDQALVSFSLKTRACTKGETLHIPFSKKLTSLKLVTRCEVSAEDQIFPNAKDVDILLAPFIFKDKDLGKIFPNIERLKIQNITGAFKNVPDTLKIVEASFATRGSQKVDLSIFSGLKVLKLNFQQTSIVPYIQNLPIPEIYIGRRKRLLEYDAFENALQKYFDKEKTDQILSKILKTCNNDYTTNLSEIDKTSLKFALSSICASQALWQLDGNGEGIH